MAVSGCASSWAIEAVSSPRVVRRRGVGAPALRAAHEESQDQSALQHSDSDPADDVASIRLPRREGAITDLASRRQACLVETPPPQLAPVEDVGVRALFNHGNGRRRLAAQDTGGDLGRLPPMRAEAIDVTSDHAAVEVLIDGDVDGGVGDASDPRHRVVRDERALGAVPEQGQIEDDALLRQLRHGGEEFRHRQVGQIRDPDALLERSQIAPRDRLQLPIELRGSADDEQVPHLRLEAESDVERRREGAFHGDAGDMRRQRLPLQGGKINAAEDDRDARE
jgi:hypothetical protein